ncbi:MAG: lamin tail domain-containing protein [Verrucomicrobiota bacterium]
MCLILTQMFNQPCAATRFRGHQSRWAARLGAITVLLAGLATGLSQSPTIGQPPVPPTIFLGDPATFQVTATGSAPLAYQWYRDDVPLPGATSNKFTLPAVATTDHGALFSVRITNLLGAALSAPVALTVDFGIPGAAVTNRVLNFDSTWHYNLSNNLDGVNWPASGYNDVSWPTGPGLLAAENNSAITPLIGTTVPAPTTPPSGLASGHAYYFRTTINVASNNLISGALLATIRADDGAMIYVNGEEALRLRLPAGPVTNTSFTTGFPPGTNSDATQDEVTPLEVIALQPGANVIAAAVHQANATSSDLVWGMALDSIGYQRLRDTTTPTVTGLLPAPNSIVPGMNSVEVSFSEGVKGLNATDLLINGTPATNLTEFATDVYVFEFPPQPIGPVQITWAANADIIDRSANSNHFGGGTYNYTVDPAATGLNVHLTEFMAGNTKTILDNDGDYSDWIEIHNAGAETVNLGGWYLTDNSGNLTKWRFPNGLTLPPDTYLLVWASDKDRRNAAAPLHTNFKLTKTAGSFLGLVYSDGATLISAFTSYPTQSDDVSYGRDRLDSSILGFFNSPTPGAVNATAGTGFTPSVQFSRRSGTFQSPFQLALSSADSNAVIRYFLVTNAASAALTNVPDSNSPIYTGPLNLNSTVQVRARAFATQPNTFPSEPGSETFLQITAGAAAFSSDVPIVLFHNFNGNTPSATADQNAVMMVFDTKYGRASLTNPPVVAKRIGINIRGSSTQGLAKSSYAVETWDEFNDDAEVSGTRPASGIRLGVLRTQLF